MTANVVVASKQNRKEIQGLFKRTLRVPIATKLILSHLAIIILTSTIFTVAGIQLISNRIVADAQETVKRDLNSARGIYTFKLQQINDIVRLTADRYIIITALKSGNINDAAVELLRIKGNEKLDLLTITDTSGMVLIRADNWNLSGDDQSHDNLVAAVLRERVPVAATAIIPVAELEKESPLLAKQAYFKFIDTPMARGRNQTEETSGMMLKAAAPIFDREGNFLGVVYGGVLLNKNYEIVDEVKQTVFQGLKYKGKDIGSATIFQDDVRISTNVSYNDGSRAIGTRIMEEVYNQVVDKGQPWVGRAYVVNSWYITAYEPIENLAHQRVGILYVGILEQKYQDIKTQIVFAFLTITILGVLITMAFSYFISQRISIPIRKLVSASKEIADGNLNANVKITSSDELGDLAYSFNKMSTALKERDEQLKEFAKKKISESERLAMIGQLAANVAHELNNPLQGIITYASLSLEKQTFDNLCRQNINKIVVQANRCRDIIRGLLDFSRQKHPDKTLCNINSLLQGCISLVENQAIFHNIDVTMNLDHSLPMIIVDPSQIERVFLNLIINAAEAMEGTGKLILTTTMDVMSHSIDIDVQDTGSGISPEDIEKVFDPFFTTKETGHGVGLGLAISYGIVEEHNGKLTVKSELGKGTTFRVSLLLTQEKIGVAHE
ncbi:MAG TPA: cache domain-containing protein [Anaerolineales bacterium]|nr:cache domain-containing protein [Anaerolineales bacterium]